MPAKTRPDFALVHDRLKAILRKYEGGALKANPDKPGAYILIGPPTERSHGKEVWFGGVRTTQAYVSYHLMAIYAFPDLLQDVSPALKQRMQGKSCFNFRNVDDALFKELARLTDRGYRRYTKEKLILRNR